MQHQPTPIPDVKFAHFYREGDQHFRPIRMILKRKEYQTIEALKSDLNKRMWLQTGVRSLFTPRGRHQIFNIDEIENGGNYVCSSSDTQAKPVDPYKIKYEKWNPYLKDIKPPGEPSVGDRRFLEMRRPRSVIGIGDSGVEDEIRMLEDELYSVPKKVARRQRGLRGLLSPTANRRGGFFSMKMTDINLKPMTTKTSRDFFLPAIKRSGSDDDSNKQIALKNNNNNRQSWPPFNLPFLFNRLPNGQNTQNAQLTASYAAQLTADPKRGPGFRHWVVRVSSGEMPSGMCTSIILMTIHGRSGVTPQLTLTPLHGVIYSGAIDVFKLRAPNVGTLLKIRIETSNTGTSPDWFCESIILEDEYSMERFMFVCRNWLSRVIGDRLNYREIPAFGEDRIVAPGAHHVVYEVTVQTGDVWNGGTTGRVCLTIYGDRATSSMFDLNNPSNHEHEAFRKSQTDIFRLESSPLGEIRHIRIAHTHAPTTGMSTGWYLDCVAIRENDLHTQFHFPGWRWLSEYDEDRKLAVDLRAVDTYNYICLQDSAMWPYERWKFHHVGAELIFYSTVSRKALRITPGGYIDARGDSSDRQGVFQIYDIEENDSETIIALVSLNNHFLSFSEKKQIVSRNTYTKNSNLRLHTASTRTVSLESYKIPNNYIAVASNGQLYTDNESKSQQSQKSDQQFHVYVKGCFRDNGHVMLCTSRLQTLCIDRDPSALTALGARNRVAHFRVYKVQPQVRMFESLIFPGHFLQIRKNQCDCLGKGDRFCEFRIHRCREQNFVMLESENGKGFLGFTDVGHVRLVNCAKSGAHQIYCRIYPEVIEFGRKKDRSESQFGGNTSRYDNDPQIFDSPAMMNVPPGVSPSYQSPDPMSNAYHDPGTTATVMMLPAHAVPVHEETPPPPPAKDAKKPNNKPTRDPTVRRTGGGYVDVNKKVDTKKEAKVEDEEQKLPSSPPPPQKAPPPPKGRGGANNTDAQRRKAWDEIDGPEQPEKKDQKTSKPPQAPPLKPAEEPKKKVEEPKKAETKKIEEKKEPEKKPPPPKVPEKPKQEEPKKKDDKEQKPKVENAKQADGVKKEAEKKAPPKVESKTEKKPGQDEKKQPEKKPPTNKEAEKKVVEKAKEEGRKGEEGKAVKAEEKPKQPPKEQTAKEKKVEVKKEQPKEQDIMVTKPKGEANMVPKKTLEPNKEAKEPETKPKVEPKAEEKPPKQVVAEPKVAEPKKEERKLEKIVEEKPKPEEPKPVATPRKETPDSKKEEPKPEKKVEEKHEEPKPTGAPTPQPKKEATVKEDQKNDNTAPPKQEPVKPKEEPKPAPVVEPKVDSKPKADEPKPAPSVTNKGNETYRLDEKPKQEEAKPNPVQETKKPVENKEPEKPKVVPPPAKVEEKKPVEPAKVQETASKSKKEETPAPAPTKKPPPAGPAPTVKPAQGFDAKKDCETINKGMQGSGTDEQALIGVLTRRSYAQREEIAKMYKQMYSKELMNALENEIGGNFLLVLASLLKTPADLAVSNLTASLKLNGKDDDGLAEVICSANSSDLQDIKQKYQEVSKKSLEEDLAKGANAVFRKLLISILRRPAGPETTDKAAGQADAKRLDEELKAKDEPKTTALLSELLSSRSRPQMQAIFTEYEAISQKKLDAALKEGYKGEALKGYLAVTSAIHNPPVYFAQRLNTAMGGTGPKNAAVTRIIVTRCEIDLELIKQEYKKLYNKTLGEDVAEETFGDFETSLTSLINGNAK